LETTGLRIEEVVEHWSNKYPEMNLDINSIAQQIIKEVIAEIKLKGEPLSGVFSTLDIVKGMDVQVALASSSSFEIIDTVIDKFNIRSYFDVVYSAEGEKFGKPHPAVYLTTAQKLNVSPQDCVAIEDSLNGVIAAKAAKMKCIAIPDKMQSQKKQFYIADMILNSLEELECTLLENII